MVEVRVTKRASQAGGKVGGRRRVGWVVKWFFRGEGVLGLRGGEEVGASYRSVRGMRSVTVGGAGLAQMGARTISARERRALEGITKWEETVFKVLTSTSSAFEKRLVYLPSSGEMINTLSLGNPGRTSVVMVPGEG